MRSTLSRSTMLASLTAALATVGSGSAAQARDIRALPLIDQGGRRFSLAALGHRTTAVTFISTRCTDTCPISEALFVQLAHDIRQARIDAGLVMITLDPDYDSPFVLSERASDLGARAPLFRLAWAPPPAIRELERAFGVVVEMVNGQPDEHSAFIYVLDSQGTLTRTLPLSNRTSGILAALRS